MVVFEGEKYSITKPPDSTSSIVKKEKQELLAIVDFPSLTEDLGLLGTCFRIAYQGSAGFPLLQVDINQVGYETTKLCDDSTLTINKFKRASTTVVNALQSTYEYLLSGMEPLAVESLADVRETAKGMAEEADKLAKGFDKQADKVMSVLSKTYETQGKQMDHKKKLEETRTDYKAKQERAKAEKKDLLQRAREVEKRIAMAERKEKDATKQYTNFLYRIGAVLTRSGSFHDHSVLEARKEREREIDKLDRLFDSRSKVLGDLAEFGERITNLKRGESLAEAIIEALNSAIAALRSLADIMRQASLFWVQMQVQCEELGNDKVKEKIERALSFPEEKRLLVWTSDPFKRDAIRFYAKWVALENVSIVYSEKIKITGLELHSYMRETLKPEEAREKVKILAVKFLDTVNRKKIEHAEKARAIEDMKKEEAKET